MTYGWSKSRDDDAGLILRATGAYPGAPAGLLVLPDHDVVVVVLANSWGAFDASVADQRSEMVVTLPRRIAEVYLRRGAG